jgi:hypothetical protein
MVKYKTRTTGQSETYTEQWQSSKHNSTPRRLPENWKQFFQDVTLPIRLRIGRLLLCLSALSARSAVKIAPEMVGR